MEEVTACDVAALDLQSARMGCDGVMGPPCSGWRRGKGRVGKGVPLFWPGDKGYPLPPPRNKLVVKILYTKG